MRRRSAVQFDLVLLLIGVVVGISTNVIANAIQPTATALLWSVGITVAALGATGLFLVLYSRREQPGVARQWTSNESPYPGLSAFSAEYAGVFFGRKTETSDLIARLQLRLAPGARRPIFVIGPSGVGKSSLVQAGVLPVLRSQPGWLTLPVMVPEDDPVARLAEALARAGAGSTDARSRADELLVALTGGPPDALAAAIAELTGTLPRRRRNVLLVVDQAEEIFTRCAPEQRARFLTLLDAALAADSAFRVIMAMRSEFLTPLLETEFAHLADRPFSVGVLGRGALREVVSEPARLAGISLETGLVDRIVDDTERGDALPLVAYTLRILYEEHLSRDRSISLGAYRQIGGVAGALSRSADRIMAELQADPPGAAVLPTLLRFVVLADGVPARRSVPLAAFSAAERVIVDTFVDERLLTVREGKADAVAEPVHEAFFRAWRPMRDAIELAVDNLRQEADLARWSTEWDNGGRQPSYLLRGSRLHEAEQWLSRRLATDPGVALVREFVNASRQAASASLRWLSETIARQSLTLVDDDPEYGLLLAVTALEQFADTDLARQALVTAFAATRLCVPLLGHTDLTQRVAWAPDGQRVASASYDRTVRIWPADGAAPPVVLTFSGHVHGVAWAPDGNRVVSACDDGVVRVNDAGTGGVEQELAGHIGPVRGVAWSPDGRWIASAGQDGTTRLWETSSGAEAHVLYEHEGFVHGVAFAPDSKRILTAGMDQIVRVWTTGGDLVGALAGHEGLVRTVAFAPSGTLAVTASYDRTARIWDLGTGHTVHVLDGHADYVQSVCWSPDGRRVATASSDRTARIWDAESGLELLALHGHGDVLRDVSWSPGLDSVATCCNDGSVRIWRLAGPDDVLIMRGHSDIVESVSWSPEGDALASASADHTGRVWNAATGLELYRLVGHAEAVHDICWSPDGAMLVTVSNDRTARLWRAGDGTEISVLGRHPDRIESVAWSPGGELVATSSNDRTVRVWRVADRHLVAELRGHGDLVRDVCWAPDGTRLATSSVDGTCRVWAIPAGEELGMFRGHNGFVHAASWSPDGVRVVSGGNDRTVRVWDAATGTQVWSATGHTDIVRDVNWSPDGRLIVSGSLDGTVRVWDAVTGTGVLVLGLHNGGVERVAWSADGTRLATSARDKTIRVWQVTTELHQLIDRARARIFRELTAPDKDRLGLGE